MAITYGNVAGQEPSTVTFRAATVQIARGSTTENQEIMVVGDPLSSVGMARVLAAPPASTEYGLAVRVVGGPSSAVDLPVFISGNSTVIQGTNPWVVSPNSTAWIKNAGVAVDSSNYIFVKNDPSNRYNIGSTAADNAVAISGNSTVLQGTNPWVIGFQAGNISSGAQSGASSGLTTRPVWSSSNADQPVKTDPTVRHNIGSTAADNAVAISGNSTVIQGTSPWVVSEVMNSSVAPSSGSSGVIVRPVIDNILTSASTNAFTSSNFSVQSSAASVRSYVVAYSITSTVQAPTTMRFMSGSTLLWPVALASLSSAVSGANLAVSAPAYLFRTKSAGPLTLNVNSSVAGFRVAVSYFRAP